MRNGSTTLDLTATGPKPLRSRLTEPDTLRYPWHPMGSLSDFIRSTANDALLPFVREALEDAVLEVLNDRQVPTRTDFKEVRDLVNSMRGSVSSTANLLKKIEARVDALEAQTKKATPRKKAAPKKAAPRKKAAPEKAAPRGGKKG